MPWSQTSPMDQRTQFVADYLRASLSTTDLCALYVGCHARLGISGLIATFAKARPASTSVRANPAHHRTRPIRKS